ncbi:hypothetical protein PENNAL_c0072G09085 [Penicillium nalgiovense]|uniref:NmrA-like domain-containing protein n=1 Tax=Penicillium nalgiovense TaxID=60175 RepID=A0A1V6XKK7_PENNA|nr:hypothetical protein PENNAL_c0072G09085 [Penicillium nalgiovense]
MSPSILIAGATGNTGRSTTETLSKLLQAPRLSSTQPPNPRPHTFSKKPNRPTPRYSPGLTRAFIASHNKPTQFADESTFYLALLHAGVKYVVRISTTAAFVRPDAIAYYPRAHWAIEALLESSEFKAMHWTSMQPNIFGSYFVGPAAEFIKEYRKTGRADTELKLMAAKDGAAGIIDPHEVGVFAAHLLVQEDTAVHSGKRYVLNGPENISGEGVVRMIERAIGVPVENVRYKDMSALDAYLEMEYKVSDVSHNVISSIRRASVSAWDGEWPCPPTSKEVLELAPPKRTPQQMLDSALQQ